MSAQSYSPLAQVYNPVVVDDINMDDLSNAGNSTFPVISYGPAREGDLLRLKGGLWNYLIKQIRPNLNGSQRFQRRTTGFLLLNTAFYDLVARIEIQERNLQQPFNRRRRILAFNRRHRT